MGVIEKASDTTAVFEVQPGLTIADIVKAANVPLAALPYVVIKVNDEEVEEARWTNLVTSESDEVGIYIRPAGGGDGKSILRLVAIIAVAVAAPIIAGSLNGVAGLTTTVTAASGAVTLTSTGIAVAAGVAAVGSLIVNALIPPPSINVPNSNFDTGESYFITGVQNSARPYATVPIVYGRMKMVGNLASQPSIFSAGDSSLYTALLDFGLGQINVFNVRAGDTPIGFFQAQKINHKAVPDYLDPNDPAAGLAPVPLQLLQYPLNSEELSVGLTKDQDFGTALTVPTAFSAVVELYFPQGVAYYDQNGDIQTLGVTFRGEYKLRGTDEWLPWPANTQGYAGETGQGLWFGAGAVTPGDPNPPQLPAVSISVPSQVDSGANFVLTISFNQDVYAYDSSDIRFIRASDSTDVTAQFDVISDTEITPNRVWQLVFSAPTVGDGQTQQYFAATNLQNFTDAPPPNGLPFPDTPYNSNNFQVVGADDGGPDDGPPPETNTDLFDTTEGNETYVLRRGFIAQPNEGDYVPGDPSTWSETYFEVWVDGSTVVANTGGWQDYAGVFQSGGRAPGFGGGVYSELWTLKNADGSPGRVTAGSNRFYPGFPGIDPSVFAGQFSLYGNEVRPGKASIVIQFPEQGEYEIRVRRIGDTEDRDDNKQYFNAAYWSRLASRGYPFSDISDGRRSILDLRRRHTMMELSLEASERVQGNIQQISATCVSQLRGYRDGQWTTPTNSRNPAWIVADLLTGYNAQQIRYPYDLQDCPGYVKESQLNMASFQMFATKCREIVEYEYKGETLERRRYEIDVVLATDAPLLETVQNILGQCRAQLIMGTDGKLAVMMDEDRADEVRQLFTPANSWDFSAERTFPQLPHGLIVEFVSPDLGYQKGEVRVYRPGYDASNATVFENLKTFGVTNWHMAAQYGMYAFGQMILRQETFSLKVAAESLVVQRGDVVEVCQDSAGLGGGAHLIVEHDGASTFVLSEEPNEYDDAHYTIKTREGVFQGDVVGQVGRTVQLDRNFQQVYANENAIIVIGQKDLVTKKYIINAIRPLPDLSAELTLLPYDARVYNTDDGEFPEWTPGGDGDPQNPENGGNARTTNLEGFSSLEYQDRQPISVSTLTWDLQTADAQLSGWRIQWSQGGQDVNIDIDLISSDKRSYEHKYQANTSEFGAGYYTVTPISQLGYDGQGDTVFVTKSQDRIPPGPPRFFRAVAEPGFTKFLWERPDAPDIGGYQIYYLQRKDNNYENITEEDFDKATFLTQVDWDETYIAVPFQIHRNGACFWMVCTDTSGNSSEPAYFDGLEFGIPRPGKVEPFDFSPEEQLPSGETRVALVEWLDLVDPNELILEYELRWHPEENRNTLAGSQAMDRVPPRGWADRYNYYILYVQGWPEYGTWYIRAHDKFGQSGPWSLCSSGNIDYRVNITGFDQYIWYLDRMPFTRWTIDWEITGAEAAQVNRVEVWLYPRQAEGKNLYNSETLHDDGLVIGEASPRQPLRLFYTNDMSVTSFYHDLEQLPRGDIYHQGEIHVIAMVDFQDIGSGVGIQQWQMEYDEEGPPCSDRFEVITDPDPAVDEIWLQWSYPDCPDRDVCEIRYASRTDKPWEESEVIARLDHIEASLVVEDRPGKYMMRYTDTSGNPGCINEVLYDTGGIDPNEGWVLLQSIQGHLEWNGVLDGLVRVEGVSTLLMSEFVEVIDGKQTAYFYYDETSDIPTLGEVRIVNDLLEPFGDMADPWEYISDWPLLSDVENMAQTNSGDSNVEIYHEVKLPGSSVWQQFADSEFALSGVLEYRIRLVNLTPGEDVGIERSRILIYAKEEANP